MSKRIAKRHLLLAYFGAVVLGVVSLAGCGRNNGQIRNPDILFLFADPVAFKGITNGMELAEVRARAGGVARHGFTVTSNDTEYLLVTYDFENSLILPLLFADGRLLRIVDPPRSTELLETYEYQGVPATRQIPWTVDQAYGLIAARAISAPVLSESIINEKLGRPRTDDSNIPSLLMKGARGLTYSQAKRGWARNRALIEKYDGLKIGLGMTSERVNAVFGEPLFVERTPDNETVAIYGEDTDLAVSPLLVFSCVAVVFRDNRAERVFSRWGFCDDWKKGKCISAAGGERQMAQDPASGHAQ